MRTISMLCMIVCKHLSCMYSIDHGITHTNIDVISIAIQHHNSNTITVICLCISLLSSLSL